MTFDSNIEERFLSKLIKDTLTGSVKWEDNSNKGITVPSSERATSKIYTAVVNQKNLRVYEYQMKNYTDEDEWDWVERVRLELTDKNGETLYEFGYDYSLYKLFNAVRKSNSGVNDFMKDFLKE